MNILTEKLPVSVVVKGKRYKINADFKTALKIINYSEEAQGIKLMIYALKTFYVDVPEDIEDAVFTANMELILRKIICIGMYLLHS